jgi:hypothetical protein
MNDETSGGAERLTPTTATAAQEAGPGSAGGGRPGCLRAAGRSLASKLGLAAFLLMLAGMAALGRVATDHHAIRAALAKVVDSTAPADIAALYAPPDELTAATGIAWEWDDPAALAALKHEMRLESFAAFPQPDVAEALELLNFTRGSGQESRAPDVRIEAGWVEDPLELCRRTGAGELFECHSQTIMLVSRATALGWRARMVNLDRDDRLGRRGHTVAELWLPAREKWVLLDPLYGLVWWAPDGFLLSVAEVRAALHPGTPRYDRADGTAESVAGSQVTFVASAPTNRTREERAEDYRGLMTNVNYVTSNAFLAGHRRRHGPLTGTALGLWIETKWPAEARAISRLLTSAGTRIHPHADDVSRAYGGLFWTRVWWGAVAAAMVAGATILALVVVGWREGRGAQGRPARHTSDVDAHAPTA